MKHPGDKSLVIEDVELQLVPGHQLVVLEAAGTFRPCALISACTSKR